MRSRGTPISIFTVAAAGFPSTITRSALMNIERTKDRAQRGNEL